MLKRSRREGVRALDSAISIIGTAMMLMVVLAGTTACKDGESRNRGAFMRACMQGAGGAAAAEPICACTYARIREHYSNVQIVDLMNANSVSTQLDGFRDYSLRSAAQCVSKVGSP